MVLLYENQGIRDRPHTCAASHFRGLTHGRPHTLEASHIRGRPPKRPHTQEASHAQHTAPTEIHSRHAIGVLPSRKLLREGVRRTCAPTFLALFTSPFSLQTGPPFLLFLLRAHGSATWKSRSAGRTLPQNKLDGVMGFLGFPAVGGVFLLLPCSFWAPGPGTMVNRSQMVVQGKCESSAPAPLC